MLETDKLSMKDLPPVNPFTVKHDLQGILVFLNSLPSLSWDDDTLY